MIGTPSPTVCLIVPIVPINLIGTSPKHPLTCNWRNWNNKDNDLRASQANHTETKEFAEDD
jgi:hypothetical protein